MRISLSDEQPPAAAVTGRRANGNADGRSFVWADGRAVNENGTVWDPASPPRHVRKWLAARRARGIEPTMWFHHDGINYPIN